MYSLFYKSSLLSLFVFFVFFLFFLQDIDYYYLLANIFVRILLLGHSPVYSILVEAIAIIRSVYTKISLCTLFTSNLYEHALVNSLMDPYFTN